MKRSFSSFISSSSSSNLNSSSSSFDYDTSNSTIPSSSSSSSSSLTNSISCPSFNTTTTTNTTTKNIINSSFPSSTSLSSSSSSSTTISSPPSSPSSLSCFSSPPSSPLTYHKNRKNILKKKRITINNLCHNTVSYILTFLSQRDIETFGQTCKEYNYISKLPFLWCHISIDNARFIPFTTILSLIQRTHPLKQPLKTLSLIDLRQNKINYNYNQNHKNNSNNSNNSISNNGNYDEDDDDEDYDNFVHHSEVNTHFQNSSSSPTSSSLTSSLTLIEGNNSINHIKSYLQPLKELRLCQIQWVDSLALSSILPHTPNLLSISISQNIDVNSVVNVISQSCPLLESFSFSYVNILSFESIEFTLEHPILSLDISKEFVKKCQLLKSIQFNHYVIDEDGVREILDLPNIEYADFSDNESLNGMFLNNIPIKWPKLKSLILRDCTELEDEFVSAFAMSLAFGGCPVMSYIDCSCQWSFYNTSLLFKSVRDELNKLRGLFDNDNDWRFNILTNNTNKIENYHNTSNNNNFNINNNNINNNNFITSSLNFYPYSIHSYLNENNNNNNHNNNNNNHHIVQQEKTGVSIRWREDQCEINDFGVDPEDGVDIHHIEMDNNGFHTSVIERLRSHSICSNSGIIENENYSNMLYKGNQDNSDDDDDEEETEVIINLKSYK